jgi:hypothetical protein
VGLSGWFSPGKSYALAGNVGTGAVGTVIYSTFSGNTIYAASPALADVQGAADLASNGDRVIVPAGNATWADRLYITKSIILKAAGIGQTVITSTYHAPNPQSYGDDASYLITYAPSNPAANLPFRLSGFDLNCQGYCGGWFLYNSSATATQTKIRIDHMGAKSCIPLYFNVQGPFWGCGDNNVYDASPLTARPDMIDSMGGYATTWNNFTFDYGTINNFYHEDCTLYVRHGDVFDDGAGNRYCVRYCTVNQMEPVGGYGMFPLFQIHGIQGNMGCELYENTINHNGRAFYLAIQRGGKALIYNNHFTWCSPTINPWNEQLDSDNPPAFNPAGEPQNVSDSYYFNNPDSAHIPEIDNQGNVTYFPTLGRNVPMEDYDYWVQKASFNGSSGVGSGLFSARPSSCTLEGAGYWATDQSKLYRWHNGAWELYYTPYTYPHPYRSDPILGD